MVPQPHERSGPGASGWAVPAHHSGTSQSRPTSEPDDVVETGTTVVGLRTTDAVVLAADRRASVGGGRFVTNKRMRKIESVHPTAAVALSGAVGDIQQFVRTLRAEAALYAERRDEPMSLTAFSTLSGDVLRRAGLRVSSLLAGVDREGPHLFGLDGAGGVLTHEFAAGGSGMQVAYGVLEREAGDDPTIEVARAVAAKAVDAASERDTASGNGLVVATVTDEGVAVEEHDESGEVT